MRDPVRALARLRSISDDVSVAPGEVVREVETVAYRGEVSLAKMREQASTTEREILDEWMDGLPADRTMRFEAYVDADGFPRRVRITDLLEISTTIEFYDLGVNAPIEPPPPELVMTGEEMLEWMQAHFEASGTDCEPKSAGEGSSGVFQYPDDAENRTGERVTLCVSESATAEEPESESEADEPQP
ncbi:MAG TPA: hypothetical protein VGW30_03370 [Gaiellaceae bacterium]|nr:hypothetical protein [Gaiellaceae bacterium]